MTRNELMAYLAGSVDSDGTIGIKRSTYAMRVTRDSASPSYSERLALRHVTPQVPTLLRRTFGGALYVTKPYAKMGRPLWSWQITDRKAVACALALLPFLIVKKAQAKNLLRLRMLKEASKKFRVREGRGHAGASSRSGRHSAAMEAAYLRAKAMNRVGT